MATMGLGWRFFRDRAVSLDVGFSLGLGIRAFMEAVDAHMLIDAFSGANDYFMSFLRSKTPVAIGWSLPLSLGVNVNLPYGFTISNVVSNIGLVKGGYNYIIQEGFGVFLDDFGGVLGDYAHKCSERVGFPIPVRVDIGYFHALAVFYEKV